jgi:thiol:disulfide interchange protein
LYGLVTGTFASPCITPALALILGLVSQLKNPLLGFMMLFVFAVGMSLLLMLISLSTNLARCLPHAGQWMLEIKKIFGFLLLIVTLSFVQRLVTPVHLQMLTLLLCLAIIIFYFYQLCQKMMSHRLATEVPLPVEHVSLRLALVMMYAAWIVGGCVWLYYTLFGMVV